MTLFSRRSLIASAVFVGSAADDDTLCRRQAQDHQHRLGDLQSGLHGAQGSWAGRKGIRQGRHLRSAGCKRSAPTRRSSSSTPARSISARPPAPPRCSARSTAIRSRRSTSIRSRNGRRWSRARIRNIKTDRRPQGQARRRHPRHRSAHLPGARAAEGGPERKGHQAGAAAASGRRHRADPRRRRRLGRPRSDDGAGRDCATARKLFYRDADANTYGILNVREEFAQGASRHRQAACSRSTRRRANTALAHPDELEKSFIAATKLPKDVVEKQLEPAHRSDQRQDRQAAARHRSLPRAWRCSRPA